MPLVDLLHFRSVFISFCGKHAHGEWAMPTRGAHGFLWCFSVLLLENDSTVDLRAFASAAFSFLFISS